MPTLGDDVDGLAASTGFSGIIRIDRAGETVLERAYGLAHRGHAVANTVDTQLGITSGTKALTALTVVSLIEDGTLERTTTAREVLGADLPLIDAAVTVEHLLAHRSGIGDYFDEDDAGEITEHVLSIPVHELDTTESYLAALGGFPMKFAPDERFSYCNGGYVVLALIAERASGTAFYDLAAQHVCEPAGMIDTAFLRSDELPGRATVGYLAIGGSDRTNVLHLPVRGSGDGGVSSTAADVHRLWTACFAGHVVSEGWFAEMIRPRSDAPEDSMRYGLGFWLHESEDIVMLVGYDAGVSFRTVHDPEAELTHTTMSNCSEGAWPVTRALDELLGIS